MTTTLQSYIGGRWIGLQGSLTLRSAVNGKPVAATHAETIDFIEALEHARRKGVPALMALDFQQRAQRLKALAKVLMEHKEALYAVSAHTGATRADSWIDIEGGAGTLFAYAGIGSNELPSGNVVHEGPAFPVGKKGGFAGTHILVPRGGVAVHINAFNFPIWGLLEKFAPSFLAGMPCMGKPASATSYLTEAAMRVIVESGILPEGSFRQLHLLPGLRNSLFRNEHLGADHVLQIILLGCQAFPGILHGLFRGGDLGGRPQCGQISRCLFVLQLECAALLPCQYLTRLHLVPQTHEHFLHLSTILEAEGDFLVRHQCAESGGREDDVAGPDGGRLDGALFL